MKKYCFLFLSFFILSAHAKNILTPPNLCVAVRGNGENFFAHWPAMAKIVEHYGPIDMLAGGSSASISLFLYESVAKNKLLSCPDNRPACLQQKSLEISLLLKSFQGYFDYWTTTKEVHAIEVLYQGAPENLSFIERTKLRWDQINILLHSTDLVKAINRDLIESLKRSFVDLTRTSIFNGSQWMHQLELFLFKLSEAKDAVSFVWSGGFDAKNDERLFFRPGLISFEDLAHKFGRMGDFYAGYFYLADKPSEAELIYTEKMKKFLKMCAPDSLDKSWNEIASTKNCQEIFVNLLNDYREKLLADESHKITRRHRIDDFIGEYSPHKNVGTFVATTVLDKAESDRFAKLHQDYEKTTDKKFGANYFVPSTSLHFGYWGSVEQLKAAKESMERGEYRDDLKTQKMMELGQTTWLTAISISGAEPGLSPMKMIPGRSDGLYSIGGWSDLHPTIILKSLNCRNTVFVTRINGEAIFAQGVAKRLFNLEIPAWDRIDPRGGEVTRKNNNRGDPLDLESHWSRLSNIANPKSSISRSIKAADAVWCTDWDSFNLKNGYTSMIDQSYHGKFYLNQSSSSRNFFEKSYASLTPINDPAVLLTLKSHTFEKGWASYVGCIPLN